MSAVLAAAAQLSDPRENFEALCATVSESNVPPTELRRHIDGMKMIEATRDFYGDYAEAAAILLKARIAELEECYAELRANWQKRLDELIEVCKIEPKDIHPGNGPGMHEALTALEEGVSDGFREDVFGDLLGEAQRVADETIAKYRTTLADIAVMAVDPDTIDVNAFKEVSVELLEMALQHSKELPMKLDIFYGDEEKLAEAKRRYPLWIKKQEELLAIRREEEKQKLKAAVEGGIEERDEKEHRNRVNDASLTAEQRGARQARMHEAVQPMYDLIRRVTEIAHLNEQDHTGVIDADGLLEIAQRCEAMVARIEGRVN
jgi:hypothetical protein